MMTTFFKSKARRADRESFKTAKFPVLLTELRIQTQLLLYLKVSLASPLGRSYYFSSKTFFWLAFVIILGGK